VEELARDTQGEYEILQEKLQLTTPNSQLATLSFLEGGLRLERGGSDDEDNIFARMARRRRRRR